MSDMEQRRQAIRYEARATVMFGAYAVWASYEDGTHEPVLHGTPMLCLREADRLNRELGVAAGSVSPRTDR